MIALIVAAVSIVAQRPTMLIYQETLVEFTDADPNVLVSTKLGEILEQSGKVSLIVWRQSDPTIQAARVGDRELIAQVRAEMVTGEFELPVVDAVRQRHADTIVEVAGHQITGAAIRAKDLRIRGPLFSPGVSETSAAPI